MTKLNIQSKSQLAKLFATENLSVEHNNVKTASFDLLNRVLTLPIFKNPQGDVYDMLTAHECSHALHTPISTWSKLTNEEFRFYVNILEDTRIDRLIQKKYPGIVKNYINGFDVLMQQNFFKLKDKDINTDLMLIDKINMFYKSSKRMKIKFNDDEKKWLDKVDALKSFNDVIKLAKELYEFQENEIKKLSMLPEFDNHPYVKNYKLDKNGKPIKVITTDSDENTFGNKDDNKDGNQIKKSNEGNPNGYGGNNVQVDNAPLKSYTDQAFEEEKNKLLDTSKSYNYVTLPEPILKDTIVSYNTFLDDFRNNNKEAFKRSSDCVHYWQWLKQDFLKFKKENAKTVMYLVKEFEMKKAASAYKRATIDKTGVIDPLKLKNYKFDDNIFKRLTILPNSKNHGMMMLLDWSGSMSDILSKTIYQLMNLIWFCQKINIPFEVYLFKDVEEQKIPYGFKPSFKYKNKDLAAEDLKLINIASHKMKKNVLHEAMTYLYLVAKQFNRNWEKEKTEGRMIYIPENYRLTSTPLNEALLVCQKLIPIFKDKYKIEKLTFITLTDGETNSQFTEMYYDNTKATNLSSFNNYRSIHIIKDKNKNYSTYDVNPNQYSYNRTGLTSILLNMLREKYNVNTIGFFLSKSTSRYSFERFVNEYEQNSKGQVTKNNNYEKLRKQFLKEKTIEVSKSGYNKYFIVNAKDMGISISNLNTINTSSKVSDIKRIFVSSMKNRIHSRVLLNRFIEQVA